MRCHLTIESGARSARTIAIQTMDPLCLLSFALPHGAILFCFCAIARLCQVHLQMVAPVGPSPPFPHFNLPPFPIPFQPAPIMGLLIIPQWHPGIRTHFQFPRHI